MWTDVASSSQHPLLASYCLHAAAAALTLLLLALARCVLLQYWGAVKFCFKALWTCGSLACVAAVVVPWAKQSPLAQALLRHAVGQALLAYEQAKHVAAAAGA